ncbi:efflux RND transporter periplasmic adaptor subunit [Vibrio mimicus]|uniref:efflux RND transporter periplasmic adaptor subunit n=1 Tax=Vibrio mimicus TaxID=674 RepID=UPI002F95BFE4
MRKINLLAFYAICLLLPSINALADNNPQQEEVVRVSVAEAKLKSIPETIDDVGKVYAVDMAVLSFNIDEKISLIHVKDGDEVKKGQLIAELSSGIAKADVAKAQSEFNLAKNKLGRSLNMIKREPGSIPPQKIYELKENVNLAKAELDQKEAILQNYQLIAPFDGYLTDFKQSEGSYIKSFSPLVSLFKLNPVEIFYSVSQENLCKVALNQNVSVTTNAVKNTTFNGVVDYISPEVNMSSGRVDVHARVKNPALKLSPGMFVNVKHFTNNNQPFVLVPQTAINVKDKERYVWRLNKDQTVSQKTVKLGANLNDGNVVIQEGLVEKDQVVITGNQWLKEGMKVQVEKMVTPSSDTQLNG